MADSGDMPQTRNLATMLERAMEWVDSTQGRTILTQAARDSEAVTKRLEEERRIDPRTLFEPVTL